MQSSHRSWQAVLSLLVILGLVLTSVPAGVGAQAPTEVKPKEAPMTVRLAGSGATLDARATYRVQVTLHHPKDPERLRGLGVTVLAENEDGATVLATEEQMETLARLGFRPRGADQLATLLAAARLDSREEVAEATLLGLLSADADGDGLTDTEEGWWCTNPMNPDSDGDGTNDGDEVQAARDWLANERSDPPGTGKPFAGWPSGIPGCQDDDNDDVPDLAERWDLGLNMNNPSTDRDRYDDGMELFGLDSTGSMSPIVQPPGDHPYVAAYPVIHVDAVPGTFEVETVTELHLDTTVITGTAKTYGTAETRGTSDSVADTVTWNEWQEVSITTPGAANVSQFEPILEPDAEFNSEGEPDWWERFSVSAFGCAVAVQHTAASGIPLHLLKCLPFAYKIGGDIGDIINRVTENVVTPPETFDGRDPYSLGVISCRIPTPVPTPPPPMSRFLGAADMAGEYCPASHTAIRPATPDEALRIQDYLVPTGDQVSGFSGRTLAQGQAAQIAVQPVYQVSYPVYQPVPYVTETRGHSWGGAHTTTHTEYQEHTVSTADTFSSEQGWTEGWAKNTAHSADLTFSYRISNSGTDYARELSNVIFNVYLGRDPHPAFTCQMNDPPPDRNCNLVSLGNVFPGEMHEYTTGRIWLSFEQMEKLDLGGPIYVVVDSYSLGDDDVFFENARQGGVTVVMDDGVEDGDESLDIYVLPRWEGDTVLDVLARYFPNRRDDEGNLLAISTPEWTIPPTWVEHALTDASWFNLYLNNLGDGSVPFRDTPAQPDSTLLMRYQTDSDRDGYTDRSELRLGTDPDDPASHPSPGLVAGLNTTRAGDEVAGRLAFLNTGNYDAYGVEANMYAPDQTVSIGNNTIGGSGRVKAASQVVLGSRVLSPGLDDWVNSTAQPYSTGSYSGNTDQVYTFTADATGAVGSSQPITLTWTDGSGGDTLVVPAGYQSPLPLSVSQGVEVGFYSGSIIAGDSFTVAVQLPRDTFTYTVESEPFTEPGIVVSYNDPQGNHRFITAVELADLGSDLAPYAGQMLAPLDLQIATTAPFTRAGSNTTHYIFNLPDPRPIEDGHLFVEYVKDDGTLVAEQVITQTLLPGPNVLPVTWDTGIFSETHQTDHDYNILALVTDWQGNIIQSMGRPLSSFQEDPGPEFQMSHAATWDFGTVAQGEILEHTFTLANTGFLGLYTYLAGPEGGSVEGARSRNVPPADTTTYAVSLDTQALPTGPYSGSITIRTSDAASPVQAFDVVGTIVGPSGAAQAFDRRSRPWDKRVLVYGDVPQYTEVDFSLDIEPDTASIEPCKVFDASGTLFKGVGKYCSDLGLGTGLQQASAAYDLFGDGADGPLTVSGVQTVNTYTALSSSASAGSTSLSVASTSGFAVSKEILIHQSRGVGAGTRETHTIAGVAGSTLVLEQPLANGYTQDATSRAQVIVVPHYTDVGVQSGGVLTAPAWDGSTGGILAFRANGTLTVNGSLDLSGKGFRGGVGAVNGNSYSGEGSNKPSTLHDANTGGSGGGTQTTTSATGGAGGGNGSAGQDGKGQATPKGGRITGNSMLTSILFGGGGGGGDSNDGYGYSGNGGNGGGAIIVSAKTIDANGSILARGNNGGSSSQPAREGGGGAGGSILLQAQDADIGTNLIRAQKGLRGGVNGGDGGEGRIHIEYCGTLSGSSSPGADTQIINCHSPQMPATSRMFGNGADGPLTVTSPNQVINTYSALSSSASPGATSLGVASAAGFAPNQEIMIHQTRGVGAGTWEANTIAGVAGTLLSLQRPLDYGYTQDATSRAQVIRVPNYTAVTVESGGGLTAPAWDGNSGGILAFRANDRAIISGTISVDGKGYRGGSAFSGNTLIGRQGEGMTGDRDTRSVSANGSGGGGGGDTTPGAGGGGGGGGHSAVGTAGTPGDSPQGGGAGGDLSGNANLTAMTFGGGGGTGGTWTGDQTGSAGPGGQGGGIVFIGAKQLAAAGSITSSGSAGGNATVPRTGGSGGGAGGAILLRVQSATLETNLLLANGGAGGQGDNADRGGAGAAGRVRVDYCKSFSGITQPTASTQELACYIAEKVDASTVRLTVPDQVSSPGISYAMQFGRRLVFSGEGSQLTYARVISQTYSSATMDAVITNLGGGVTTTLTVAVGGQPVYEDTRAIAQTTTLNIPNFANAVNEYIASQPVSSSIDIPIGVTIDRPADVILTSLAAVPGSDVDATLTTDDISFGASNPTEGETVPVTIIVHNVGGAGSGPLTAAAYAEAAGWGEWYVGSAFLPDIPAGGTAEATIQWNTLGFTGTVPLRVVADPYDRMPETNEWNNEASTSLSIKTRPDLHVSGLSFTPPDGREGQPVTIMATISNSGETDATSQSVAFYDGAPSGEGTLLGTDSAPVPAGGSAAVEVGWTATGKGLHTIYAVADSGAQVSESREDNNATSAPLYVGLYDQVYLDSGGAPDPAYDSVAGYGWVSGTVTGAWGPSPEESFRWNQTGPVRYQFDYLVPSADYHVDVTLLDGDGGIHGTETLWLDGVELGSVDLTDGQIHWLSIRPDGVLYDDHALVVDVTADGFGGAVVSEIAAREIDYRYVDCGPDPAVDPPYSAELGHGYLNGYGSQTWGTAPYETFRYVLSDTVRYRFDGLDAARDYQVNVTLYQEDTQNRQQTVVLDGAESGLVLVPGSEPETTVVPVPGHAYSLDGSVVVGVRRTNGNVPIVNAIALEERTVPWAGDEDWVGPAIGTPSFSGTVASDAALTVTVSISDATSGGHGVSSASLFYGYESPYDQSQVPGAGPGGNGDGTWTFEIPAQGEGHEGETLWFWLTARDGDDSPASSVENHGGGFYGVTIEGVRFRIYLPLVMRAY